MRSPNCLPVLTKSTLFVLAITKLSAVFGTENTETHKWICYIMKTGMTFAVMPVF